MPFCLLLEEASVYLKLAYFFHLTSQWKTQTLPTKLLLSNLNYQHSVYKEHEHVLLLAGSTEEDTFNCYISCVGWRGLQSDDWEKAFSNQTGNKHNFERDLEFQRASAQPHKQNQQCGNKLSEQQKCCCSSISLFICMGDRYRQIWKNSFISNKHLSRRLSMNFHAQCHRHHYNETI